MFAKSIVESKLDAEIQAALDELSNHEKTSEEYGTIVERISKLHKLKTEGSPKRVSPDTALAVAANIFGVLWLTAYETERVIKARSALSHLLKPR